MVFSIYRHGAVVIVAGRRWLFLVVAVIETCIHGAVVEAMVVRGLLLGGGCSWQGLTNLLKCEMR